jgi:hypothetical protein
MVFFVKLSYSFLIASNDFCPKETKQKQMKIIQTRAVLVIVHFDLIHDKLKELNLFPKSHKDVILNVSKKSK